MICFKRKPGSNNTLPFALEIKNVDRLIFYLNPDRLKFIVMSVNNRFHIVIKDNYIINSPYLHYARCYL